METQVSVLHGTWRNVQELLKKELLWSTEWERLGEVSKDKLLFQDNKQGHKIDGKRFKEAWCEAERFLRENSL